MKLRILDNSIRLRLSKSEVDLLDEKGELSADTPLPSSNFKYSLECVESSFQIQHSSEGLKIQVPKDIVSSWANSNRVGFRHTFELEDGSKTSLLVEKDFKCLTDASESDQSDFYEHPYAKTATKDE
ncbi:hypothetical protein N9C06_04790 [Salibacteraceae bacterium]|jgi:hypothetical protein|nr:hypothetical protein [Salibacteraceae bacterium]